MSTHNHFDDDNDNTNDERGAAAQGPESANAPGKADGPDGTGHAADADDDIEAEVEVDEFVDVDDRPIDHEVTSEDAPNLARLLRQAGRSLRREFLSAVADEDIDPRDVADLRRRGRRHRHDEDVADGGAWTENDHRDDADGVDPDELRDRVRALRDRVSAKVEDILTADEVAAMSESLTKIIDALGGDDDDIRAMREKMRGFAHGRGFGPGWGSDGRRGHGHHRGPGEGHHRDFARDDSDSAGPRDHRGPHDHSDRRPSDGPRGYDDFGDDFDPRMLFRRGARRGGPRGGGRGFGPGDGPGSRDGSGPRGGGRGFGPWGGFGPGGPREGFDADCDPRMLFAQWLRGASGRGREDAYERGFAAGFAQGQRSAQQTDSQD